MPGSSCRTRSSRVSWQRPEDHIRVWSAGCASGEEAYTLAMVLAEILGPEKFRDRVKIYATDIDEEALNQARLASYGEKEIAGVPPELVDKYFERQARRYVFHKDFRRAVIFGRHDLINDAPISRVDLLVCRNALMYFNAETQARILARFHFALHDGGSLFLGKAEMLFTQSNNFAPIDLRRRIFAKVPKGNLRDRLLLMAQAGSEEAVSRLANHVRLREAAFDAGGVAEIVIDMNGHLILANDQARALFSISQRDLGRPLQDLEISYRPLELRSLIEQALSDRRVQLKEVEWIISPDRVVYLDVLVSALKDNGGTPTGCMATFTDVSRFKRLQDDLQESNQELEAAYEELQSTSEELETTNEELQSTVEELETTNEELQSTNEELETMNEELQSTNEELQTINDELRQRSEDLNQANSFMSSVLTSLRGGVVVVDRDLLIRAWSPRAEDLWGLRHEEVVDQHLMNLDIGLPVEKLHPTLRAVLTDGFEVREMVVGAVNRRGRAIQCKVTCTPLTGRGGEPHGALLLMEELDGTGADGGNGPR